MQPTNSYRLDQVAPQSETARQVGLARQFMSADLVTRGDGWERGVRSVLLQNDLISIEVVVDRALDIASARIRQLPVAWRSPTAIVAPWFIENAEFGPHRSFFGGLLTTCGLDHIGPPTKRSADRYNYPVRQHDAFPMHGRISGSPAQLSGYGIRSTERGLEAYVEGTVSQVAVFGEHLVLRRTISILYGSARVSVSDEVINEGYATTPLAVLYHVNVGWPVLTPDARIQPPLANVAEEQPVRLRYPQPGSQERVWTYNAEATQGDYAVAGIVNSQVDEHTAAGLALSWKPTAMPTMVQWEIANIAGNYAVGLEPTTRLAVPGADGNWFPVLEAGQSLELGLTIELLHGTAGANLLEGQTL